MPKKIPHIILKDSLKPICMGCPSDWDAKTIIGEEAYIRLRHGYFRIDINNITVADGNPNGYDGVMCTSDMINYVNSNFTKVKII